LIGRWIWPSRVCLIGLRVGGSVWQGVISARWWPRCGRIVSVKRFVLDASAVLRLYLADGPLPPQLEEALAWTQQGLAVALVPDLCFLEVGSVLLKQCRADRLTIEEAAQLLIEIQAMPLRSVESAPMLAEVFDLATEYGLSVYDAAYLALAKQQRATLITADQQLQNAAARVLSN